MYAILNAGEIQETFYNKEDARMALSELKECGDDVSQCLIAKLSEDDIDLLEALETIREMADAGQADDLIKAVLASDQKQYIVEQLNEIVQIQSLNDLNQAYFKALMGHELGLGGSVCQDGESFVETKRISYKAYVATEIETILELIFLEQLSLKDLGIVF